MDAGHEVFAGLTSPGIYPGLCLHPDPYLHNRCDDCLVVQRGQHASSVHQGVAAPTLAIRAHASLLICAFTLNFRLPLCNLQTRPLGGMLPPGLGHWRARDAAAPNSPRGLSPRRFYASDPPPLGRGYCPKSSVHYEGRPVLDLLQHAAFATSCSAIFGRGNWQGTDGVRHADASSSPIPTAGTAQPPAA